MFGKSFLLNEQNLQVIEQIGEHIPGGFFIYKAEGDGELLYANQAVFDIFGCRDLAEFKELTGYTFKGMLHPEDYEKISASIEDQIANSHNDQDYVVYRIIRKDGEIRWIDDYGHFAHSDAYGGLYYVFISDITEKRLLLENDAAIRTAVIGALSNTYSTVFLITDVETGTFSLYRYDGNTVSASPIRNAMQKTRYPEAKKQYINTVVAPEDRDRLHRELTLENIAKNVTENTQFSISYKRMTANGERYYRIEFAKVDMPDGKIGVVCGFKDIDDEVRKEQEVQQALKEAMEAAKAASQAKTDFLANMSHEIRTPINAILGMNEMISREAVTDTVKNYSWNIRRASETLLSLLNDVLDFSKIESGKMEIVPGRYELDALLGDVATLIDYRAETAGLDFIVEVDKDIPNELRGDEIRIRQILMNLLTNAVKYTPKGRVTLSVKAAKAEEKNRLTLKFAVSDTGIGIHKKDMEKLFSGFKRLDMAHNRTVEGTGLGLTITKRLTGLMGGTISVESRYGKGSCFAVTLPQEIISEEPIGAFTKGDARKAETGQYKVRFNAPEARVLIVDDNEMNLFVAKNLLRMTKMEMDTCKSGQECLNRLVEKQYDIVLLDQMMPGLDGISTLHRAVDSGIGRGAVFIAMTANAVSGAREMFLREGFADYIPKPVDGALLEEMIMKYLPAEKVCPAAEPVPAAADPGERKGKTPWLEMTGVKVLDTELGLKYCGGMEDVYRELLEMFFNLKEEKQKEIEAAFAGEDWQVYTTLVHALKSSSLSIGGRILSEAAKSLELAGKKLINAETDPAEKTEALQYIKDYHRNMLDQYDALANETKIVLNI